MCESTLLHHLEHLIQSFPFNTETTILLKQQTFFSKARNSCSQQKRRKFWAMRREAGECFYNISFLQNRCEVIMTDKNEVATFDDPIKSYGINQSQVFNFEMQTRDFFELPSKMFQCWIPLSINNQIDYATLQVIIYAFPQITFSEHSIFTYAITIARYFQACLRNVKVCDHMLRGFIKFLCTRSVGFFSRAFLVFLMKESKKRRRKQPGKLMAKSHSQPVNLPSVWPLMNPLCAYLFGVSSEPCGFNSKTFLNSGYCLTCPRKNSLPVLVVSQKWAMLMMVLINQFNCYSSLPYNRVSILSICWFVQSELTSYSASIK